MADEPLITIPFDPDFNTAIRPRCPGLNMRNVFQARTATRLCRKLKTTTTTNYYGFKSSVNCNIHPIRVDILSGKTRCTISTTHFTIDDYQSFCKPLPGAIFDYDNSGNKICHTVPTISEDIEVSVDNRYCYVSEENQVGHDGQTACRKIFIIEDLVNLYASLNWLCNITDQEEINDESTRACKVFGISNYPINISAIPGYIRYSCYITDVVSLETGLLGNKACNIKGKSNFTINSSIFVGRFSCKNAPSITVITGKKIRCHIITGVILTPIMFGRVGKGRPFHIGPILSGRMNPKMRPAQ